MSRIAVGFRLCYPEGDTRLTGLKTKTKNIRKWFACAEVSRCEGIAAKSLLSVVRSSEVFSSRNCHN